MVSHSWLIYGHLHNAAEIGQDCRGLHLALSEKYTIYAPSPAVPRCSHLYQEGADQAACVRRRSAWAYLQAGGHGFESHRLHRCDQVFRTAEPVNAATRGSRRVTLKSASTGLIRISAFPTGSHFEMWRLLPSHSSLQSALTSSSITHSGLARRSWRSQTPSPNCGHLVPRVQTHLTRWQGIPNPHRSSCSGPGARR